MSNFRPRTHAYLNEDIHKKLRSVATAIAGALDATGDNPQYRRGSADAVRALGEAIGLDPNDPDARTDMTSYSRAVHLRRDAQGMIESVYDAVASVVGDGEPSYMDGVANTLRAIARSLDLYESNDDPPRMERPRRVTVEQPQRPQPRPQRQLPASADTYFLPAADAAGLVEYMRRYNFDATVTTVTRNGQPAAQLELHNVGGRQEWAERIIDKWADRQTGAAPPPERRRR